MAEYTLWMSEKNVRKMFKDNQEAICKSEMGVNTPRYIPIRDNVFASRRADSIYTFTLVNPGRCFVDLVLKELSHGGQHGENIYVDPITRIRKKSSSPATCNKNFAMEVKTLQGPFVRITPEIIKTTTPVHQPIAEIREFKHEDIANAAGDTGLYTNEEVQINTDHLHEEEFSEALSRTISYGVLVHQGQIQDDASYGFDISRLSPLQIANEINLLEKLDNWLKRFGSYISLLVLILEGGKICVSIAMVMYSMAIDGVLGARAICLSLFCGKYVSTQNRLEKARRRRIRNAQS